MKSIKPLKGEELEIGTTDKYGNQLKQSDFVVAQDDFEGISICQILYHGLTKEFVAMSSSGWWIPYQDLSIATEKLNHVIAQGFLGLEKCGSYWGKRNKPFIRMQIECFNAVEESTLILEILGRRYKDLFTVIENGCWYLTVNKQIYSEERLGIAACLAAVNSVRNKD
ncbi:hypothetical protein B7492_31905 (plasmid) [Bacillus mycoides]|uniref:Phage ABA sandwich domain-containing protein n=1 Tax=Bacillus mycoides TaxID=1405 RepID=A0A1W6AIN7_BACMY|nr:hypothetical protein [Bacillus mycoides]ARJ25703.1 hypothetical protein B7492_31905 [Bacillus mycoides]